MSNLHASENEEEIYCNDYHACVSCRVLSKLLDLLVDLAKANWTVMVFNKRTCTFIFKKVLSITEKHCAIYKSSNLGYVLKCCFVYSLTSMQTNPEFHGKG